MVSFVSRRLRLLKAFLAISTINVLLFSVTIIPGRLHWIQMWLTAPRPTEVIAAEPNANTTRTQQSQTSKLVCMFTSFNTSDRRKAKLYNNTLYNWAALKDNIAQPLTLILYTSQATSPQSYPDVLVTTARHLGWTVLPVPRVNSIGLPYLKDMYAEAARQFPTCTFYGFCNGDILFNGGLINTLEAVKRRLHDLNRTMVIGRRHNVFWRNLTLYRPNQVQRTARRYGHLHMLSAEDYFFIARNDFPWNSLRDVVIARRGYDNFLVMMAVRQRVSVVDATETMVAVHQSDNLANGYLRHSQGYNDNMDMLGNFSPLDGLTTSSQYLTATVLNHNRSKIKT